MFSLSSRSTKSVSPPFAKVEEAKAGGEEKVFIVHFEEPS
jgi:hypothetical protein